MLKPIGLISFTPRSHAAPKAEEPIDRFEPKVVILGGGYAGMAAARGLAEVPASVTLVDQRRSQTRKLMLWQVAVGNEVAQRRSEAPLAELLDSTGATFRQAEVRQVDAAAHQVHLADGSALPYDYLVVALGSRPAFFGHPEWAEHMLTMNVSEDAFRLRQTVQDHARQALGLEGAARQDCLRFVVIGGGATGVELAGVVHEVVQQVDPALLDSLSIKLVHSRDRILSGIPEEVSRSVSEALEGKGIELCLNQRVTEVGPGLVRLASGDVLQATEILWGAGVEAPSLLQDLGKTDRMGRVEVTDQLNLPDHPEVFVVGDAALAQAGGKTVPPDRFAAVQQADRAVENIKCALEHQPLQPFAFREREGWNVFGPTRIPTVRVERGSNWDTLES